MDIENVKKDFDSKEIKKLVDKSNKEKENLIRESKISKDRIIISFDYTGV